MFIQGRLLQLQMQQSESKLLTTLQVQTYSIELCKLLINQKGMAYIFQQTIREIKNTVMPKNKALFVLFV